MRTQDIVVGAAYIHPEHPGTVYLGCGLPQFNESTFNRKCLVVIRDGDLINNINVNKSIPNKTGFIVYPPHKYIQTWWNKFKLMEK